MFLIRALITMSRHRFVINDETKRSPDLEHQSVDISHQQTRIVWWKTVKWQDLPNLCAMYMRHEICTTQNNSERVNEFVTHFSSIYSDNPSLLTMMRLGMELSYSHLNVRAEIPNDTTRTMKSTMASLMLLATLVPNHVFPRISTT